jgi:2-keto-4-pentenoate hydratase/2-oxohepta-3-ene-1,7-dioic acid hydratase in catechol pathway
MVRLPIAGSNEILELRPSKIIALGLNYRTHIVESPSILAAKASATLADIPTEPILFAKTPNVLAADGDPIIIPAILADYDFKSPRTDYEAELAFILSRPCRNIRPEDAMSCILGFTCFNDVSQRDIQNRERSGWFRGKSFDSFGPIGPRIVPLSLLPGFPNLRIACRLNGKTVQDASISDLIFPVAETLSFISRNMSLEAGDIVSTGTPAGVGPLSPGDVVEIEIEGIGILKNPVIAESDPRA